MADAPGSGPAASAMDSLRVVRDEADGAISSPLVGERARRAAEWALELDATLRTRLDAGAPANVRMPARNPWAGRVRAVNVDEYRKLRLGAGELIRPWLLDHEELDPPPLAPLYPFQRSGVEWLVENPGGKVLADDMGLGKTIQVIAAVRLLFNRARIRRVLILSPKSLVANWEAELARWAPELGNAVVTPPGRIREAAWRVLTWRRHVLLTSYEQMRDPPEALCSPPARPRRRGRSAPSPEADREGDRRGDATRAEAALGRSAGRRSNATRTTSPRSCRSSNRSGSRRAMPGCTRPRFGRKPKPSC